MASIDQFFVPASLPLQPRHLAPKQNQRSKAHLWKRRWLRMETSVINSTGKKHHPSPHNRKCDFYGAGKKLCFSLLQLPRVRPAPPSGDTGATACSAVLCKAGARAAQPHAGRGETGHLNESSLALPPSSCIFTTYPI